MQKLKKKCGVIYRLQGYEDYVLNRSTTVCASRDLILRVTYRYLHRDYSPGNNKGASCHRRRKRALDSRAEIRLRTRSGDGDCATTTDLHKHETYPRLSENARDADESEVMRRLYLVSRERISADPEDAFGMPRQSGRKSFRE